MLLDRPLTNRSVDAHVPALHVALAYPEFFLNDRYGLITQAVCYPRSLLLIHASAVEVTSPSRWSTSSVPKSPRWNRVRTDVHCSSITGITAGAAPGSDTSILHETGELIRRKIYAIDPSPQGTRAERGNEEFLAGFQTNELLLALIKKSRGGKQRALLTVCCEHTETAEIAILFGLIPVGSIEGARVVTIRHYSHEFVRRVRAVLTVSGFQAGVSGHQSTRFQSPCHLPI